MDTLFTVLWKIKSPFKVTVATKNVQRLSHFPTVYIGLFAT